MKDLLIPRCEVIAPYPNTPFKIGEILHETKFYDNIWYVRECSDTSDDDVVDIKDVLKSTTIFRPMGWWEKRDIADMPEYVKYSEMILRAVDWQFLERKRIVICDTDLFVGGFISVKTCLPATKEEYSAYLTKLTK